MQILQQLTIRISELSPQDQDLLASEIEQRIGLKPYRDRFDLLLRGPYDSALKESVEGVCKLAGGRAAVRQQVWCNYEDSDFRDAALATLRLPELLISECAPLERTCSTCRRPIVGTDGTLRFSLPKLKEKIFVTYGGVIVVENQAISHLCSSLDGLRLVPFDKKNLYSYVFANSSLGQPILDDKNSKGFRGFCSECKEPLFESLFGEHRYDAKSYDGKDVVQVPFLNVVAFSHRGYEKMARCFPGVSHDLPVFLD
jgi:hypothetical protein